MDGRYLIVEEHAAVVRTVFQRYLEGATLYEIAKDLNARKVRRRGNSEWRANQIGRMLDNPAYAALNVLDDRTYEATWQPIVAREVWNEVQRQRLPEHRGQRKRKTGTGGPYLLTGLTRCGVCGGNCHHHRNPHGPRYTCYTQDHSALCPGGGVGRERADELVTAAVLERVRFSLGRDVEFVRSLDAWEAATMEERRRVLGAVVERVVIEPKEPGEGQRTPRRLRIEWRKDFTGELIATPRPLQKAEPVRVGRPESNRAAREARAKALN